MSVENTVQAVAQLESKLTRMQRAIRSLEENEQVLRVAHRFLTVSNRHSYMSPLLSELVSEVKRATGCAYAGIRVLDQENGIPYNCYEGFKRELCDMEVPGERPASCICNRLVTCTVATCLPFVTSGGSFYTSPKALRQANAYKEQARENCGRYDHESMAAVPIRINEQTLGLLYVADERKGLIDAGIMKILERISAEMAHAIHRVRMNEQNQHMATHDEITGLPNRVLFNYDLTIALLHSFLHKNHLAVAMLDLDHFKEVNDTLGHAAGDKLLKEVSARFQRILRKGDTLARMGGDEFMLILSSLSQRDDAALVAEKILEEVRKPFEIEQQLVEVGASIGIALYPDHGDDAGTLMKNADAAMYTAKQSGRNQYKFFERVSH